MAARRNSRRLTAQSLSSLLSAKNKSARPTGQGAKYGNQKSSDGKYDSGKECRRGFELAMMQRQGLISELEEKPCYVVIPKQDGERATKYFPDFRYIQDGKLVVEDVKSPATKKKESYVMKRKLMLLVHGLKVLET